MWSFDNIQAYTIAQSDNMQHYYHASMTPCFLTQLLDQETVCGWLAQCLRLKALWGYIFSCNAPLSYYLIVCLWTITEVILKANGRSYTYKRRGILMW